ncbi:head GIN domain-containing protein [Flavobacterium orientale]|uniref:Lipoprotein n=1 Tax=Flavobacterium orientale TaxID=1756020 RepID=A0A916XW07_9FLAO|nr:head GIN domain-containing protein [Flavobacterium orientale]GGD16037.1 lipoprotein [Flavobacterium orientale]
MIKFILNFVKIVISVVVALLATSCEIKIDGLHSVSGNKNVITSTRSTSESFTKIQASRGLDVEIYQGNENAITIEADENLHEYIKTSVENGKLKITTTKNIKRAEEKKVKVTFKELEAISTSSGSFVVSKNNLIVPTLDLKSSSGSEIDIKVESENISCKASSGSTIILSGKAINLDASTSSGSDIKAKELLTNNVITTASSGSSIQVYPILSLNAKASSGGSILYYKEPNSIIKKATSGGSVKSK